MPLLFLQKTQTRAYVMALPIARAVWWQLLRLLTPKGLVQAGSVPMLPLLSTKSPPAPHTQAQDSRETRKQNNPFGKIYNICLC